MPYIDYPLLAVVIGTATLVFVCGVGAGLTLSMWLHPPKEQ